MVNTLLFRGLRRQTLVMYKYYIIPFIFLKCILLFERHIESDKDKESEGKRDLPSAGLLPLSARRG